MNDLQWKKPGAGQWKWDQSHAPGAPTPLQQTFNFPSMTAGLATVFDRYGIPLRCFSFRLVNNKVYGRLLPLIGAERELKPPPAPLLWLAVRLHPAFRRRNRNAKRALRDRIWRGELQHWNDVGRARWTQANLALQDEPVETMDDAELADHLGRALAHATEGHRFHFELHGTDLAPLGDLVAHCEDWGVDPHRALGALEGASPASAAATDLLRAIAAAVGDRPVSSLDDVRAGGPEATRLLDEYLREYGWRMVTSYDVDGRTLIEMPNAILASIRAADDHRPGRPPSVVAELRSQVPDADKATFDELIAEARTVYGLRDDNGPLTVEWPIGLLRRAVIESGRRLADRDCLHDIEDACELEVAELQSLLEGKAGPSADDVASRRARRAQLAAVIPPLTLGDPEPEPPLALMPPAMARVSRMAIAAVKYLDAPVDRRPMAGLGIGTASYTGTARVTHQPDEALCRMAPGDVLVARFTNPAFNTLLGLAGAVVCEEGGVLSHTAVMARELGIPAVIGAAEAMTQISDGDTVEVDPVAGRVRVVSAVSPVT